MAFTKEQKQMAYKKLSSEAQNFVMSSETDEKIDEFLSKLRLGNEQKDEANIEIFYSLLGLQTLPTALEKIEKITNKSSDDLSELREKLESTIFLDLLKAKDSSDVINKPEQQKIESSDNIGNSYERIILNQARAMQPAREVGSSNQQVASSQSPMEESKIEEKVPKENSQPKINVPNYSGQDPYREPIE